MSKSIVTLQLGNYSNFIGSHYWNLHEFSFENSNNNFMDNDINYYEGLTVNKHVTFTPKVISWDWKENLGPRIIDDIYEEIENSGSEKYETRRNLSSLKVDSFGGKVEMNTGFTDEELKVNETTEIENKDYKEWNEYVYARFHPNSLTKLPKLFRNFDSGNFRNFSQGLDLSQSLEYFDRMEDQTRYFVEKCDFLQGFQMLCDSDDGFSGVGINFLNHLSDEYSKDIISFPASCNAESNLNNVFNKILLYNEMNSKSVFWSPISARRSTGESVAFGNVNFNPQSKYETSAILAVALKSLLLPCFVNQSHHTLSDYSSVVDRRNNNLASMAMSMPFPLYQNDTIENSLSNLQPADCFSVLNPYCQRIGKIESMVGNIFGVDQSRARNKIRQSNGIYDHCSNVAEMMETFFNVNCLPSQSRFVNSINQMKLKTPFPNIFSSRIDRLNGELRRPLSYETTYYHCPDSLSVSTVLFSDDSSQYLLPMYDIAKSALKSGRLPTVMLQLESDFLFEIVENFRDMI